MLRIADIVILTGYGRNKCRDMIIYMKRKNGLTYPETIIPVDVFCNEYHLPIDLAMKIITQRIEKW